jgi:hypothetical protein
LWRFALSQFRKLCEQVIEISGSLIIPKGGAMKLKLYIFLTGITFSFFASAQVQPQQHGSAADLQSLAKLMKGTWNLKVNLDPTPQAPKGIQGVGEETWRTAPLGLTLTDEETFTVGPMKMAIVGLFWMDHATRKLQALDCSNQNRHTCSVKDALDGLTVQWDGRELIVEEPEPGADGKMMTSRIVWSDIKASSFTETAYFGPPGGPFKKGMTILATRRQ